MFYPIFLVVAFVITIYESRISARNSAKLVSLGAVEVGPRIFPAMAILYGILYFGSALEYWWFRPALSVSWIADFLALFVIAKLIKIWVIRSLGQYWTMRVLIVPNRPVVTRGPYRWIKHPNYVSVLMEILAIALAGKSWRIGTFVFLSFLIALFFRIRGEERGLRQLTDYSEAMENRRRFLP